MTKVVPPLFSKAEKLFSALVEGLPAMLFVVNRKSGAPVFEYVSPGCLELTGYRPEELIGHSSMVKLAYHGDIPKETSFQRMEDRHGASPDSPHFSSIFRIVTAGGQIKWVREMGKILFSENGEQVGIMALAFDCTRSKNVEMLFEQSPPATHMQTWRLGGMIGSSPPMQRLYQRLSLVAQSDAPVLITGETGVGKELAARAIHTLSVPEAPFVAVNCGGHNENLLDSALFGHMRGAFTGAYTQNDGLLAQAGQGILFLDEVGEIPLSMQVKLLRVLDGYGYTPVGGTKSLPCRFRLVSATNRNLEDLLQQGLLRHDFFYRINTLSVPIPSLRERKEDLPLLIDYFLKHFSTPDRDAQLPNHIRLSLQEYSWPGNVRELRSVIHRFLTLGELDINIAASSGTAGTNTPNALNANDANIPTQPLENALAPKEQRDLEALQQALQQCHGSKTKAAELLGIHPRTLARKMKRYKVY